MMLQLRDAARAVVKVVDDYEQALKLNSSDVEKSARRDAWEAIDRLRSVLEADVGGFVYIVDRDDELDVYADPDDAAKAAEVLGYHVDTQAIFLPSSQNSETRGFLHALGVL